MILKTTDTRAGKDDAGVCIGAIAVVMDDDAFKALGAAVQVAYDAEDVTAETGGLVTTETADELFSFFRSVDEGEL